MTSPFKIGLQLPEVEYVASWNDYLEMAWLAEDLGFDSLWVGDHLLYREGAGIARGPWECLTMLTALAAVTTRVELGPLVLSTSFRNPALTAKIAETIDEISNGRFVLGLGAGWNSSEYEAFGYPFDNRISRFEEAFTIIRQLIREGETTFHGKWYTAEECLVLPRGPRAGKLPLMIGSRGERMLRMTLPYVDFWNIWYADFENDPDLLRAELTRLDRFCEEVGRAPSTLERTAAVLVQAPGGGGRASGGAQAQRVQPITGTPDETARKLAAFAAIGIDHLQVVLDQIRPSAIEWLAPAIARAKEIASQREN